MKLEIYLPARKVLEKDVFSISFEGLEGSVTVKPRHIDYVSVLVPGILSYKSGQDKQEVFYAVDEGLVVKQGSRVMVSTRDALSGPELQQLEETVKEEYKTYTEKEKEFHDALNRLEADFLRRLVRWGKNV